MKTMFPKLGEFVAFILERERIRAAKESGAQRPWTKDPVLAQYSFCNVRREDDRVTRWVASRIREPFADHPNLWVMLCIARQINWPETLAELVADKRAWPTMALSKWDPEALRYVLLARGARGEQVYTGAYMLNCNWGPHYEGPRDKPAFTAHRVLASVTSGPVGVELAEVMSPRYKNRTCHKVAELLSAGHGWGGFMAAQVVADLKYTRYLQNAEDFMTFALSGPGSRRGLNVVMGAAPDSAWREEDWLGCLLELQAQTVRKMPKLPALHAQDLQNCLCEFYKYTRGWSRSKYVSHTEEVC